MDEIKIKINSLDVDTYLGLRKDVGWKQLSLEQAQRALSNSLLVVAGYKNDVCVGMGRLVGDGAVICYVQDLIVLPEAQGLGIGSRILERLEQHVKEIKLENTEMMFCLMCAKGRESFYEAHGFMGRPTEQLGPGMIKYIVQ